MSATDAVARLLTLTPWLLERPGASIAEAAHAFGVGEQDIRDDLARLDWCGLPGMGGGDVFDVTVTDDRIVLELVHELHRPMRLHPAEALRLVLTLDAVLPTLGDDLPALATARAKVRAAAGVPPGAVVTSDDHDPAIVGTIRTAMTERRRLSFDYRGRQDDQPRRRTVEVWQLDVIADGWYVRAHDVEADGARSFRLDKVVAPRIEDTPATTTPPDDLPPPGFPADTGRRVRLRLAPDTAWLAGTVQLVDREVDGDDLIITFDTDALAWIASMVRVAGAGVTIEAPDELATLVQDTARAALRANTA